MIYIITHKECDAVVKDGYQMLQVGAEGKPDLGYIRDDSEDNISSKNVNYCELTGLYWIWKNRDDSYKGLVHYRRFLNCSFGYESIISEEQINKILQKYDIILPFKKKLSVTVAEQYCEKSGFLADIIEVRNIIQEQYPQYMETFHKIFEGKEIYFFNIMVAGKEVFNDYCEWLFSILFRLETRKDLTYYNEYQKRIYGFLAVRLLNVYVAHNCLKVFQCGVVSRQPWKIKKRILTGCKRKGWYIKQMI